MEELVSLSKYSLGEAESPPDDNLLLDRVIEFCTYGGGGDDLRLEE